jgi:methylated-DNA-[protein]-cysteine S-methyltransferase
MIETTIYTYQNFELILGSYGDKICLCDWTNRKNSIAILDRLSKHFNTTCQHSSNEILKELSSQLNDFFEMKRKKFDIAFELCGTNLQIEVYKNLQNIQYGQTISYQDLANSMSKPQSVRAIANAIGSNPMSILIPCHRVIRSDGSLGGYAGGLDNKQKLLNLEKGNII